MTADRTDFRGACHWQDEHSQHMKFFIPWFYRGIGSGYPDEYSGVDPV